MDVTILIATFNRHRVLSDTLDTIAAMHVDPAIAWEVVVVDNNSSDQTRAVVEGRAAAFPAPLRWIFERRQGKAHALTTGIAASRGAVLAFTDDDVRIPPTWLEAAVRPLLARPDVDYTGGPVRPLWEAQPPGWTDGNPGILWGPLALLDYGGTEFIFEERQRIPLGVNMAVRRSLIDRVGGFHPFLERSGASLMGQGQAEFFFRTRRAGARGLYVPSMMLWHIVPASRLTLAYYQRWWYWKGVARARMSDVHPVTELGVDLSSVPAFARVPRFMWGGALRDALGWLKASVLGQTVRGVEHRMMLAYFAGYVATRWRSGGAVLEPVVPDSGPARPTEAGPSARFQDVVEPCRHTGSTLEARVL